MGSCACVAQAKGATASAAALRLAARNTKSRQQGPRRPEQALIFCRTNFDCDNLERFLNGLGGGGRFQGARESGREHAYSCAVLGGARAMEQRRAALQVRARRSVALALGRLEPLQNFFARACACTEPRLKLT